MAAVKLGSLCIKNERSAGAPGSLMSTLEFDDRRFGPGGIALGVSLGKPAPNTPRYVGKTEWDLLNDFVRLKSEEAFKPAERPAFLKKSTAAVAALRAFRYSQRLQSQAAQRRQVAGHTYLTRRDGWPGRVEPD